MDDGTNEQIERRILHIPIARIVPGMVVARDILTQNGQLVLAKDAMLEPKAIAKIFFYAIPSVYVYEQEEEIDSDSFYVKVQKSQEFQEFHVEYCEVVQTLKGTLQNVLNGEKRLNEQQLLQSMNKIIHRNRGKYHLFELLYCMQEQDDLTFMHSINVAAICNVFGHWLQMPEQDIDVLTICGLLHDVGKITIPKEILYKPGKLTPEEFVTIRKHPYKGYLMLVNQNLDKRICLTALQHHERYDGTGYPLKQTGDQIHTFAMITAIADVFDAMTNKRTYRDALCPFSVLEMFENEGKIAYDLSISMPLMERIAEIYINHTVQLNNQQRGEVILLNRQALSRPVVKVRNEFLDLSKHKDLHIDMVV